MIFAIRSRRGGTSTGEKMIKAAAPPTNYPDAADRAANDLK
jgi:hypothetical protein